MKRTIALAILGVATANTVVGQGVGLVSNYLVSPYNQVVWALDTPTVGGQTVSVGSGALFSFWIAPGFDQPEGSLVASTSNPFDMADFNYDAGNAAGTTGWYLDQNVITPAPGDYTLQIRAAGSTAYGDVDEAASRSGLYNITTAAAPVLINESIALEVVVPEPTTFALAGLGAAALLIFRRRA